LKYSRLSIRMSLALGLTLVVGCAGPGPKPVEKPASPGKRAEHKAPVNGPLEAGFSSFELFCTNWISKLRNRQQTNERSVQFKRAGSFYIGEFTGYGRRPLRCEATPTGKPVTPLVGRIGYHEIRYQKSGKTRNQAQQSQPRELYRIEVTELFRYDGSTWVY
jgi:hypothetical protein